MKRLDREGHVITVPRPKDECYLYMPNPALIHTESSKIRHYLAIADVYIQLGKPQIYAIEPQINEQYTPDVYTRINDVPIIIEVQRSYISNKKMQQKINQFVESYRKGEHDATILWVFGNYPWKVDLP